MKKMIESGLARTRRLFTLVFLLGTSYVQAATYTIPSDFGSGILSSCGFVSGSTYRCAGNLAMGNNDAISVQLPMTLQITGDFTANNNLTIVSNGHPFLLDVTGDIVIKNNLIGTVNLRAGGSVDIGNNGDLTGTVLAGGTITLGNNTSVSGACSPANARCSTGPLLQLAKVVVGPTTVFSGKNIDFRVTVSNAGSAAAPAFTVQDALPSGLVLVSATPSAGSYVGGNWTLSGLAAGASAILNLRASAAFPGSYTNTASLAGLTAPASATAAVVAPVVSFVKSASASVIATGATVNFTILVRNDGASGTPNVTGISVSDVFPCSGLTRGAPTVSQGSLVASGCGGGSETITWTVGTLVAGASATMTLPSVGSTPGSWVNVANLSSPDLLSAPPSQSAPVTVKVSTINQVKMEVGDLTVIDTYSNPVWTQVNFTQIFDRTPFVFTLPTDDGANSGAHRIRNVTTTGFQVTTVEPGRLDGRDGEDGPHIAMGLSYLAIDSCPGGAAQCSLTLSNGDQWQLGFVSTARAQAYGTDTTSGANWEQVSFSPAFAATPAVLAQVQTLNNETGIFISPGVSCPTINGGSGPCPSTPWLTSVVDSVSTGQMKIALERSEARWGSVSQSEVVAYVAAVPTSGRAQFLDGAGNTVKYEIIRTAAQYRGWDNGFVTQNYSSSWAPDVPKVIASMNSRMNLESTGNNSTGDGGWLRREVESNANQQSRVRLTVDEVRTGSQNSDGDRRKNDYERAGIFAFNRGFAIDPVKLDHVRIVHDGAAQSCLDEPLVIKACGDAACNPATLYSGAVSANLAPSGGSASWSGGGVVGSVLNFSGGSAPVSLAYSNGATITLGLSATPVPQNGVACYNLAGNATSCTMVVSSCASQIVNACEGASCACTGAGCAANYDRLYTKITGAGFSFGLVALRHASGFYVLDSGFSGTAQVDLVANQGAGACPTPVAAAGLPGSTQNVSFSGGRPVSGGVYSLTGASNSRAYENLRVRFTQGSPASSNCSIDNFSIRPATFSVTSTNATNSGAAGTPVFKAGSGTFNLTATAVPGYAGTPLVANAQLVGTPTAGTINGGFSVASSTTGVAIGNIFTYSEVGNLGLSANAIYDETFTSIDQPGDCSNDFSNILTAGRYGCKIGSIAVAQTTGSSGFGRFIPDHLMISGASITPAGGAFTYMEQPFGVGFTLTAANAGSSTTTNYTGSYAKLDSANAALWPSATLGLTGFALGARDGSSDVSGRLAVSGLPTGSWNNGVANVAASFKFERPASLVADFSWGPYDALEIGIAPRDADGVTLLNAALNLDADNNGTSERQKLGASTTKQRFGRLRMSSAYGSELLPLRVAYRAEYWDGVRWAINGLDSSSPVVAANVWAGGLPAPTVTGLVDGVGYLNFAAAAVGAYDVALNLSASGNDTACNAAHGGSPANKPWLKGFWTAAANCNAVAPWAQDPNARLRFGSPKAPYIYLRERY